jgi:hypothetical protein
LVNLGVDGRILLKWALRKWGLRIYTRLTFYLKFSWQQDVHGGLLGCDAMRTCRWLPMFQRKTFSPSSALKTTMDSFGLGKGPISGLL